MRKLTAFFALCCVASLAFAKGASDSASKPKTEIIVSAAASLTDAMTELIALYGESQDSVAVKPTFGSSGSLQAQIEQGAPVDVFIPASPKQMNALEGGGLLLEGTRKDLLKNSVVLVVAPGSTIPMASFADVASPSVTRVALGDFKSVPAGQYAEQVFTSLGMLETVSPKAVFAKDVRQVLAWVESGEVDCGVVYATDAAVSKSVAVAAVAPEGSHTPVVYPAAAVSASVNPDAAKAFLSWLSGPEARAVFASYGFSVP